MKSRLPTLERKIKDEVAKQMRAERSKIYDEVSSDVVRQTIALCASCLEKQFDFEPDQIREFINSTYTLLSCRPFGKSITSLDALEYIKTEYGIDLDTYRVSTRGENECE